MPKPFVLLLMLPLLLSCQRESGGAFRSTVDADVGDASVITVSHSKLDEMIEEAGLPRDLSLDERIEFLNQYLIGQSILLSTRSGRWYDDAITCVATIYDGKDYKAKVNSGLITKNLVVGLQIDWPDEPSTIYATARVYKNGVLEKDRTQTKTGMECSEDVWAKVYANYYHSTNAYRTYAVIACN